MDRSPAAEMYVRGLAIVSARNIYLAAPLSAMTTSVLYLAVMDRHPSQLAKGS